MGLFKSDTVGISHDISVVYSPSMGQSIITLVDNNPNQIRAKFGLGNLPGVANGLLDELRCYASISSLSEIAFPDIKNEDPEAIKVTKAQSFEWKTARFELVVFKKAKNAADWAECGVSALKNSGGFRYRIHRMLDLVTDNIGARVGEWGKIGVSVRAVGYGVPAAFDRITFTGNWQQEFTWVQEHPTYVQINQYGSSSSASPSPTPTPTPAPQPTSAPTLTVTRTVDSTGYIYADADTDITFAAGNLLANYPFTVRFVSGGTTVKSDTYTSTADTWTRTFKPSELNQYGSKNYTIDFIHGNYTLNNPTSLNIVIPVFSVVNGATYNVGTGKQLAFNFSATPYKAEWYNTVWTFSFAKDNGSGVFVDKTDFSQNVTLSFNGFVQGAAISLNSATFANAGWGNGTYKVKATKGAYSIYSVPFVASVS
ncbi:hypothetical protein [Allocoleopsis franciscana]|uniref:Uncharacterized protein n=1 Tax=Allocoleopsis franciscana PCC 7113 TaxID=1173027 RepID=K9WS30_9CYAN|nr:hypothetical protein [Allocoleopsis franciscana]AFZ22367.1 hypothetical protein Mic7113_6810 [Allocoleopsis franciscana PCC 7113]